MMTREERLARARQWMESSKLKAERWGRYAESGRRWLHGKYSDATMQCPRGLMNACLAALAGDSPRASLTVEGAAEEGAWRLVRAWWEREESRQAGDNLLALHVFYADAGEGAEAAYVAEDGCAYRVTAEPHWDEPEVPDAPEGSSGIVYRITGARRDDETGLWEYVVEKRERLTVATGVRVMADDEFRRVEQQTFVGVREGDVDHTGAAVALWAVGNPEPGVLVENVSVTKNDDCTVDIVQRRTAAHAETGEVRRERTVFGEVETVTLRNQPEAVDAFVDVAGGKVTVRTARLNDDGTWDNTQTVRTALEGAGGAEYYRTAFQEGAAITLRNQPGPVAAWVDVVDGVITRQSARRNDDGTWDNTQTLTMAVAGAGGAERYVTMFQRGAVVRLRNQPERVDAAVEVSGGVITRRQSVQNDDGTWDNTETVTTAVCQMEAEVSYQRTPRVMRAEYLRRNMPQCEVGYVDPSSGAVNRQTKTLNDDGTWDNREQVVFGVLMPEGVYAAAERWQTLYETGVRITRWGDQEPVDALEEVAGGVITRRRAELDEETGRWTNTETLTTERPVAGARRVVEVTPFGTRTRVTDRNQAEAAADPAAVGTAANERTEAGRYNRETDTFAPLARVHAGKLLDRDGLVVWCRYFNLTAQQENDLLQAGQLLVPAGAVLTVDGAVQDTAEAVALVLHDAYHARRNRCSPAQVNAHGLMDGMVESRPDIDAANAAHHYLSYTKAGLTETQVGFVTKGGKLYRRETLVTFTMRQGYDPRDGLDDYAGALSGSFFHMLGRMWYRYKKVTAIGAPVDTEVSGGGA